MTKIIFMGTPDFAATVLAGLLADGRYEVAAVVTQPDRPVGRKHLLQATPVKALAVSSNLTVLQPAKLSGSDELAKLVALGADGIVTAAYGQFLPMRLIEAVGFAVNVHGSLLPRYRGGAPIQRALMADEPEMGVTLIEMVKKMDAGRMLARRAIPVTDADTAGTMFERLAVVGRDLLLATLPDYLAGKISPEAQDEGLATISPNLTAAEERIDWTRPARQVFNQIRALSPFPGAHTLWRGQRLKVVAAREADGTGTPGTVVEKNKKNLTVACGTGALQLVTIQPAGKPQMPVTAFLNGLGRELKVGDQFGE